MNGRQFVLHFDLRRCEELDRYALLASQAYNLGDRGKWFSDFRGGLYGFGHRLAAVSRHYAEVHAWIPRPRDNADAEHIGDDPNRRSEFWPMEEIILSRNVKRPYAERYPTSSEDLVILA